MASARNDRDFHLKVAADCFNGAWPLLDDFQRDEAGDRRLLDLVHASGYHWGVAGGPREKAISDWQISRAYASVNEPGLALRYAESCLAVCQEHALAGLLSTAYEGIARAHGLAGRTRSAREYLLRARAALDVAPVTAEERRTFLHQIRDTERKLARD